MDQLRNALSTAGLQARPDAPDPAAELPNPQTSPWVARLRELGGDVPRDGTMPQLLARTGARAKELRGQGRARDAQDLERLRDHFVAEREKKAWTLVKSRFAELQLAEKAYRAVKQEGGDPEKILARLHTKKADSLRGASAERVRDALLG